MPKCKAALVVPKQPASDSNPADSSTWRATNNQKAYATKLGIEFSEDVNRKDISAMIDKALDDQKLARYNELDDIQNKKSDAYVELRDEIIAEVNEDDPRLSKSSITQMLQELSDRDVGSILVSFEYGIHGGLDEICLNDVELAHSDDIDETDAKIMLMQLGVSVMKKHVG